MPSRGVLKLVINNFHVSPSVKMYIKRQQIFQGRLGCANLVLLGHLKAHNILPQISLETTSDCDRNVFYLACYQINVDLCARS